MHMHVLNHKYIIRDDMQTWVTVHVAAYIDWLQVMIYVVKF